jgi:hypothetical protein
MLISRASWRRMQSMQSVSWINHDCKSGRRPWWTHPMRRPPRSITVGLVARTLYRLLSQRETAAGSPSTRPHAGTPCPRMAATLAMRRRRCSCALMRHVGLACGNVQPQRCGSRAATVCTACYIGRSIALAVQPGRPGAVQCSGLSRASVQQRRAHQRPCLAQQPFMTNSSAATAALQPACIVFPNREGESRPRL